MLLCKSLQKISEKLHQAYGLVTFGPHLRTGFFNGLKKNIFQVECHQTLWVFGQIRSMVFLQASVALALDVVHLFA